MPEGVQGWDRYGYVNNNPVIFIDPSGHLIYDSDGQSHIRFTIEGVLDTFGVDLQEEGSKWSSSEKVAVLQAVSAVAQRMGAATKSTSINAFRTTYNVNSGDPLKIIKVDSFIYQGNTYNAGGVTINSHTIKMAGLAHATNSRPNALAIALNRNNIVHEFGHAFANCSWNFLSSKSPYSSIPKNFRSPNGWPTVVDSASRLWRQNSSINSSEVFADMFLGWTFNTWGISKLGQDRKEFMTTNMVEWLTPYDNLTNDY